MGDDASCALSSSEDEISEDECPGALEAAAGIAEAAAAVIQIPVTDELKQHPEAAKALQGTEQWEGGLTPPLYLFHHRTRYTRHFHTQDTLPRNVYLLCNKQNRRQEGQFVRGPPPVMKHTCKDCLEVAEQPYWQAKKAEFEKEGGSGA